MPQALSPHQPWTDEQLRAAAHDLKNELASILALTEMLEVMLPPEAQPVAKPQIEKIRKHVKSSSESVTTTFQALRSQASNSLPE